MSQVLVVIPTIFEHPHKYVLLDQLVRDPYVAQIVIVDNGNCFQILENRKETWAKVEIIRPGCNLNWLASCNLGITLMQERKLPYVCLLNDDTLISNPFFAGLLETYQRPDAALVVPRYNGYFGTTAYCDKTPENWRSSTGMRELEITCADGTCMLLSQQSITKIGFLDPVFRHPGWGADIDYCHRVLQAGLKIYVSLRSMLWHVDKGGGTSARILYGDVQEWLARGTSQVFADLEAKYGSDWATKLSLPPFARARSRDNIIQACAELEAAYGPDWLNEMPNPKVTL